MGQNNYKVIVTIVGRGKAGRIVDISERAGAVTETILSGHGAAVRLMLGVSVEPEREIVFTLVEESKLQPVIEAIEEELEKNEPNTGISVVISIDRVIGHSGAELCTGK